MNNRAVNIFVKCWYALLVVATVLWTVYKFAQDRNSPQPDEIVGVVNLTTMNFDAGVTAGVSLVYFGAPWCGPCHKQLNIVMETLPALPVGTKIAKVNIDNSLELTERFRVSRVPTWIVFRDGKPIGRGEGIQSKEDLLKLAKSN